MKKGYDLPFYTTRKNKPHLFIRAILVLFSVFSFVSVSFAQKHTPTYPLYHHMSDEEAKFKHLIGRDFFVTAPPEGPVRNVAEFERMQAVLIRYPFGISYSVIAEMAEDLTVLTVVEDQSEENYVTSQYSSNGVNLSNCEFLHAPTNSIWSRDYGPWFIFDGNDDPGIVNFPYNRPRPLDDEIPIQVATYLGINLFGMDITGAGGNYMTDGMGISSSSDLVWEENPSLSHADIDQMVYDYLGINTYHVVPDPNNTYIDHIDCWGKFLDVDKVLIREVPSSHAQYDEIEATAAYYASQNSAYGTPFEVYRVYTPNNQPYTNSLILNEKVLVPIMGSQWDDDALQAYEVAMPGYEIVGLTGSWESTDALHCRTKGIADIGMLYIRHIPLLADQPVLPDYQISADITAHSDMGIYVDSVYVIYSVNGGSYDSVLMTNNSGNSFEGSIPGPSEGSQVAYYISAADQSGRLETHPFIGLPDPHSFNVGVPLYPELMANPGSFNATLPLDGSTTEILTITNNGGMQLDFTATISYTSKGKSMAQVDPVPLDYWTGTTTSSSKTETSLVKGSPPNEAGWMMFDVSSIPDGSTINSVEFFGYVNDTHWPYWNINPVTSDPLTASPSALYNDINDEENSGYYLYQSEGGGFSTGWKNHTLGGNVTADLEAALTQDWFAIGIMDRDNDTYYINFDGWAESNPPYLNVDYTYDPPYTWLTVDGGTSASGSLSEQISQDISIGFDASGLTEGIYTANIQITSNDPDSPVQIIPVTLEVINHLFVDLKVYLEGPFFGTNMNANLSEIPLIQPYNQQPWNYAGSESVASIPMDVVDWILVEYRDASNAISATSATMISQQAAFLKNDGSIVDLDGISILAFNHSIIQSLYAVVWHRNHLGILSADPLIESGGIYNYDFTTDAGKVFGATNGHNELANGTWGMISGDANADGFINPDDLNTVWATETGTFGYKPADFNLDNQINNIDKNEFWLPNKGKGSQVPN